MHYYTLDFGQAYGAGAYNSGYYSCTSQQQSSGACTATTSSSSGGLANTGVAVAGFVTLACLIVFVSIIVRVWRRKPATEDAQTDATDVGASVDDQTTRSL